MLENIFRQTCLNRFFELEVAKAIKSKDIKIPVYLSLGQEHIPAALFAAKKDWLVFPQHRCHSYFLSFGGDPASLAKELLGRKDGCNAGMGGSASISWQNFFGHSGLLGDQVPIAVGAAHASNKATLVILGDGAAEEDYVLAAIGYAVTNKVPILFVCEDNNLSILTQKKVRRSWEITDVAQGFGCPAKNINDHPLTIHATIKELRLPFFLNIQTCRHLWHAGAGNDGEPAYNRFEEFKSQIPNALVIENEAKMQMELLWKQLLKP